MSVDEPVFDNTSANAAVLGKTEIDCPKHSNEVNVKVRESIAVEADKVVTVGTFPGCHGILEEPVKVAAPSSLEVNIHTIGSISHADGGVAKVTRS